jgi:hypothetical protein
MVYGGQFIVGLQLIFWVLMLRLLIAVKRQVLLCLV